jgi:hypothetical protein
MNNSYFIGAKNVCILFKPENPIHLSNFIYYCDKLFGWASEYHKKRGSNKIYVIFPTLTRGQEYFNKFENNVSIEFPSDTFVDNLSHPVQLKGYLGHNEQQLYLFLPNIENNNIYHQRISQLENTIHSKINDLCNLDGFLAEKWNEFNNMYVIQHAESIETLKNQIKKLEEENNSLQFAIRQQTSVSTLMIEKFVKIEKDFESLDKWTDCTQNLVCKNTLNINDITSKLIENGIDKLNIDIVEMKESKKWSEEISQRQHQYALQKFNELENKIRQLEKKIMSFENKSCQEKNQENIFANIKHLTENLIPLDIEKLCKLADPVKILDIDNVNKTTEKPKDIELDNDNLDDDENMFVIINE